MFLPLLGVKKTYGNSWRGEDNKQANDDGKLDEFFNMKKADLTYDEVAHLTRGAAMKNVFNGHDLREIRAVKATLNTVHPN